MHEAGIIRHAACGEYRYLCGLHSLLNYSNQVGRGLHYLLGAKELRNSSSDALRTDETHIMLAR